MAVLPLPLGVFPRPAEGEVLSEPERRLLSSIISVVIPSGERVLGGGTESVARFERWLGNQSPRLVAGMRTLMWAMELSPLPVRGSRFSRLDPPARQAWLEGFVQSGSQVRRTMYMALVTPMKVAHFASAEAHEALGLPFGVEPPAAVEREPWMANALDGDEVTDDDTIECDVVVVGSGAGGGAVAHELASRGHAVLVLEAGRYFKRREFNGRPADMVRKMYLDHGMTFALGNLGAPVWAGQTVGGTTTINSGTCYRPPPSVLAEWSRDLGLSMLTPDALAPHVERVETMLGVSRAQREHLGTIASVIARGADALGYAHNPLLRNAPDCDGQGLCCFGCPTGAKRSADVSWIPAALSRGAMLYSSTRVTRVDADPATGRAVGVTAQTRGGATLTVRAQATVVAGGALMTPLLLQRSGLCASNRWLGRNLSIHPACGALAVMPDTQDMWKGIPQGYAIEQFRNEGIMYEGASVPLSGAASMVTALGPDYTRVLDSYRNLAVFGFMIRDTSRGRVVHRPGGYGPAILYNLNGHDRARMQRAMEVLCDVFLEAGAVEVIPGVTGVGPIRSRRDLDQLRARRWPAHRFEATAYHPLGTARMAASPRDGVIGPDHEAHGVQDLYVVDGSAVPSALGVNPQVTIMALALRAGAIIDRRLEVRGSRAA